MNPLKFSTLGLISFGAVALGSANCALPIEPEPADGITVVGVSPNGTGESSKKSITIKRLEAVEEEGKERTWLGVGLAEPDEALIAQLGLKDGVGLLVTHVAKESPAEKAGLQKNDVLLEMDGQTLVVPEQLQKLVQARKEGEKASVKFLRGGKKDSVTALLGKTKTRVMSADGDNSFVWRTEPGAFAFAHPGQTAHSADHLIVLEKALRDAKIDQKRVKEEVQRSMEEARKAMEEALRTTKQADGSLKDVHKELEALARTRVFMPNESKVVVCTTDKSNKSMVQADDSGTIVIVKNPKLRLTAHDRDGKMLFDGEIENQEQREKIPEDLRKKVEPMLEKFSSGDGE